MDLRSNGEEASFCKPWLCRHFRTSSLNSLVRSIDEGYSHEPATSSLTRAVGFRRSGSRGSQKIRRSGLWLEAEEHLRSSDPDVETHQNVVQLSADTAIPTGNSISSEIINGLCHTGTSSTINDCAATTRNESTVGGEKNVPALSECQAEGKGVYPV